MAQLSLRQKLNEERKLIRLKEEQYDEKMIRAEKRLEQIEKLLLQLQPATALYENTDKLLQDIKGIQQTQLMSVQRAINEFKNKNHWAFKVQFGEATETEAEKALCKISQQQEERVV